MFTDETRGAQMGFHPCTETLVQNVTAGGNGTAGGTLHQLVLGFLVDGKQTGLCGISDHVHATPAGPPSLTAFLTFISRHR